MICQRFEGSRQDALSNFGTALNAVSTIHKNFRLNNWNQSVLLADGCVASQCVGVGINAELSWCTTVFDAKDGTPLGKSSAEKKNTTNHVKKMNEAN